jgi:hypothetical protein
MPNLLFLSKAVWLYQPIKTPPNTAPMVSQMGMLSRSPAATNWPSGPQQ